MRVYLAGCSSWLQLPSAINSYIVFRMLYIARKETKRKERALSTYNTAYTFHRSAPRASPHFAFATRRQNVVYAADIVRKNDCKLRP